MTPRGRFVVYLVALHALFAALGAALVYQSVLWLIPLEIAFAVSLAVGITLVRRLFSDLAFARLGLQMLEEHEFASRFREVGHPELDTLVRLYNGLAEDLREERIRLQEQHHFLGQMLRVSPAGIVILDHDGRVDTVNRSAERLLGREEAALRGARPDELDSPIARAFTTLRPDESALVALAGSRRVRCHRGRFIDRGFPRDFLLVEELTEELRRAERGAYEKLIRVMAHEVNNSVAASNSLLHSCLTYGRELGPGSRADFEQALAIVIERTNQLNQFMRSFSDLYRLPPPVKRPEAVAGVLEANVRLLAARPDAAGIRWSMDVHGSAVVVPMDRGQMDQVFLNVLQNAVDATGGEGEIAVRLHTRNGRGPCVTIENSGPGIAPEAAANLFTPFFSTKPKGQGIGLTLVREILTAHGFDYSLEQRPGEPTRFTIEL